MIAKNNGRVIRDWRRRPAPAPAKPNRPGPDHRRPVVNHLTGHPRPPDTVMTVDNLAEYLKLSKSTLDKLNQAGKVPGQIVGRHRRFRREVIGRWRLVATEGAR